MLVKLEQAADTPTAEQSFGFVAVDITDGNALFDSHYFDVIALNRKPNFRIQTTSAHPPYS